MKTNKRSLILGIVLLLLFLVFTGLVQTYDKHPVAPNNVANPQLGFATLNTDVNRFFSETSLFSDNAETIYDVTEVLGYLTWGVVAVFGLLGLCQLIKRKSLLKVDRDIILLGCGYAVMLALYVLFDKVLIVNYRPANAWDPAKESSYPSSHTLMLVFVMATAVIQIVRRMNKGVLRLLLCIVCIVVAAVVTFGRLACGVHWLTDIVGGVLLAAALAVLYHGLIGPKAEA